uniref:Uncharacterized protein n=1 Tax=viral metagenome TaxID=1070528 RepID=A0A6C0ACV2_9ZZZZ
MYDNFKKVYYKGKNYAVIDLKYKNKNLPLVLDWKDFQKVKKFDKKWKCNSNKTVYCTHSTNENSRDVFIHDIVKAFDVQDGGGSIKHKPIIHLNRVNLDNRRENLYYDEKDKDENKNLKKKKRTIKLPENSGVKPEELPTYVWYLKPNDTHGERFMVSIGDIKWKTSSSKQLSLSYKLEEAKKYLRDLKQSNPELFDEYCMNGEFTKKGKLLLNSFTEIIKKANYNIQDLNIENLTDKYLKPKKLSKREKDYMDKKFN